ncbi:protein phosphatase [Halospina denitrificans]|uniref:Protein phosphatase n=1 Tax=Halospina denitrificans TaxID=332522 RepID=A0A4R7K1R0_9GAMM|nr:PP2C family serine/threonine-protein phosphatase [Halospina denitrificans]TDT43957.1 protein phosphatase [Halospina denitrificans]
MAFRSASFTHKGGTREHNEDALLDAPQAGVWVVADGMGGHQAGDVASQMTCDTVAREVERQGSQLSVDGLRTALKDANEQIRDYARDTLDGQTVGATVIALRIRDGRYHVLWAGDSRCYRLRAGALVQISRDHSQVAELVDQGLIRPDEADGHPLAHVITRALGVDDELSLDYATGEIQPGDLFLLCSDGVSNEFGTRDLEGFLGDGKIRDASHAIMYSALVNKCGDNITCIIVNVDEGGYDPQQIRAENDADATVPVSVLNNQG